MGEVVGMIAVYDPKEKCWFYFYVIPTGVESFGFMGCKYMKWDGTETYETGDRGICEIYDTQIQASLEVDEDDGTEWLFINTFDHSDK